MCFYLICRLQEQATMYIKKIEIEKKKVEELDKSIAKYQERILEQKSRLGGINAAQENNILIKKQIQVLENRLNKHLLKFNETLAQNKELRQRIDDYRRERVVFDVIYKKLERELHEKKKEMAAIIKDSKNAYQIRDKSLSEMTALQQHADKEKTEFEIEFKDLGDLIKQQQLMLEQLRLKQFERKNDERVITKLVHEEGGGELASPLGVWSGTKDKSAPLSQEKIHSYEDSLLRIQESTGIYDINEIVTRFLEAEEQNFSLFNYVNDINSDIEKCEHKISEMRNQVCLFLLQNHYKLSICYIIFIAGCIIYSPFKRTSSLYLNNILNILIYIYRLKSFVVKECQQILNVKKLYVILMKNLLVLIKNQKNMKLVIN